MSETPTYKRIIEERLSHEIFSNDYLVKDSATEGTTRILISEFIDLVLADSATEEDLETAVHNFVPEYDSATSYSVGNYCIYLNELYRCTTATTGDFDDSDWTATNAMSELVSLVSAEATARTTAINNEAYYRSMSDIVLSENIAEPYNTTKSYVVGDIVSYNLYIYRCTGATTGTWDASKWEQVTVDELFDDLNFSADAISYDNTSSGLEADDVQDAIDETITKLSAVGSASGDIATFPDGSDLPMPKLEVGIEPVQDLHGYDAPWVGGSGKNKLPLSFTDGSSVNGITIYKNADGTVKITGKATSQAVITIGEYTTPTNQSIKYSGSVGGSASTYSINIAVNGGYNYVDIYDGDSSAVSVSANDVIREVIVVRSGYECPTSGIIFYPMIRNSSESFTFAPYSNICQISGWSAVDVTRTGKNLWNNNWSAYTQPSDYRICPIKLENGQYTASVKLKEGGTRQSGFTLGIAKQGDRYSNFGSFYTASTGADKTGTITVDDTWTSPKLIIYCNNETAFNDIFSNYEIQFEEGSTATTYEPYNGHTYTLSLGSTRYGGKVDLVSGVMTVDRVGVNMGSLTWIYDQSLSRFYSTPISDKRAGLLDNDEIMCSCFRPNGAPVSGERIDGTIAIWDRCYVKWFEITDATVFKERVTGQTFTYPLATPLTIQLSPTQVKSLQGINNVWADCGAILDAEYIRDLTTIIDYILEQLNA